MRVNPRCWLAQFAPPHLAECDGRLDPVHLIPQRLLKREFPHGIVRAYEGKPWKPIARNWAGRFQHAETRSLDDLLKDERIIRPGCRAHHHALDTSRKLKIPRSSLPETVEEFARELGHRRIDAFLVSEYGELSEAA